MKGYEDLIPAKPEKQSSGYEDLVPKSKSQDVLSQIPGGATTPPGTQVRFLKARQSLSVVCKGWPVFFQLPVRQN